MKNTFARSIAEVFKGAAEAFKTFPAAILCAALFAVVTIIRIKLDWPEQEAYNFLFNCLHWALALGALLSLAAITTVKTLFDTMKTFLIANALGIFAAIVAFIALFFWGEAEPAYEGARYAVVSRLAGMRVTMGMVVSFLVFVFMGGYLQDRSDFARSFFMSHKAFFIAMIYGAVIMSGLSGVAGAVEALLYNAMSSKVYMYLGTLSGFIGFTIFIGYFPDFSKRVLDEQREIAQKQPRFIEVLFGYIMVPIVLALTLVLLLWAVKTIVGGMSAAFIRLSAIATAYAAGGIWLHIMLTHHEAGLARIFRRIYPIAALVILAFEAWALFIQLGKYGLKLTEYSFALIWISAVVSVILLLILQKKAHPIIAAIVCFAAIFAVLPGIGYHALPVSVQVNRLENVLLDQGMLVDGKLSPAKKMPDTEIRQSITDAVNFLAYAEGAKLPDWLDPELGRNHESFKKTFGFEQTWPERDPEYPTDPYLATSLTLPSSAVDISNYTWAVSPPDSYGKSDNYASFEGKLGSYRIYWQVNESRAVPIIKVILDERVILEENMNSYIDRITAKYPPGQEKGYKATLEDMSLAFSTPEVDIMLIFNNINIGLDAERDMIDYWFALNTIYIKEK